MGSYDVRSEERSRAMAALVSETSSDWYGAVSLSVYETARVVMLAPWLAGHRQRLLFLLERQRQDGMWGGPDRYGLVPTLSATEALLSSLRRWQEGHGHVIDYGALVSAADRGLRALFYWLRTDVQGLIPDTVAAELVIPALVEQINEHLDRLASEPLSGLDTWSGSGRLMVPSGVDDGLLARLRYAVGLEAGARRENIYTYREFKQARKRDVDEVCREAVARALDGVNKLWIGIDTDVLTMGVSPDYGDEPLGITVEELLEVVYQAGLQAGRECFGGLSIMALPPTALTLQWLLMYAQIYALAGVVQSTHQP